VRRLGPAIGLILAVSVGHARADSAAEIAALIAAVRNSPCQFLRNGDPHGGAEAAEHIAAKYRHFEDEIASAEDFIDRAATRSILSGKPYEIACPGQPVVRAADWLRARLRELRGGGG
jgi:hypothetical protein